MKLKIITQPAVEPLTLEEVKNHLRVTSTDDDTLIASLIKQAREYAENFQNRKYVQQTIEGYLNKFPYKSIEFPIAPVQSITSIKYTDYEGNETTVDDIYTLDNISYKPKIDLNYGESWATTTLKSQNGVKITFVAGYEPTGEGESIDYRANIPETFKWAMLVHISLIYDDYKPTEIQKMQQIRDNLLGMEKVW